MYSGFKYESIPLKDIALDDRNPRIVTQAKLSSHDERLAYLFEYEDLERFIKKISSEGKNVGAERPYVVKTGSRYTVIEGNTRIAAYKVLTGLTHHTYRVCRFCTAAHLGKNEDRPTDGGLQHRTQSRCPASDYG